MPLRNRLSQQPAAEPGGRESRADDDYVTWFRSMLLDEINLDELTLLTPTQRRARLEKTVGELLVRHGPVMPNAQRSELIRKVVDSALGLGVLEPLLADPTITEIMVNGRESIWIERFGRMQRVDATFANDAQLYQAIDRIVAGVNRRVDEASPMVDARLPSGERVNVIVPPLALTGPTITIRRFPQAYTLTELQEMGSVDLATVELLRTLVRSRFNIVISGGTGTGKTTLLNALSGCIPDSERILTIEDSAELQLQQPHVIALESRPPNVEGKGAITIRDLVRNSLRMRPDRIIVGEVRGAETLDMLQAMNTGHEGSLVTVHANSPEDAIARLETLASMSELDITFDALRDQINSAVHVIVHLARYADGSRRVSEISVIVSRHREALRLETLMRYAPDPIGPDRQVSGRVEHLRMPDSIAQRIYLTGEQTPAAFAGAAGTDRTDGDRRPVPRGVTT